MARQTIRIFAFNKSLKEVFSLAGKNKGQTRTEFLRPKIREIVDSFPDELKEKREIETGELHISGVPEKVRTELRNIADNIGVTENDLLKIELFKTANELPDWMKVNPDSEQ